MGKIYLINRCHAELVSASQILEIPKQVRNDSKIKAFTLAEVLITLTIIGIIAALTITNLMQRYQEHVTVNKVKKFYSTLSNAYAQAQKEYGTIDENWTYETTYENIFKPYFKISKVCKNDFCGYSSVTQYLNGTGAWWYGNNKNTIISLILDDGSYVWITGHNNIKYFVNPNKNSPQIWGKNLFSFGIIDNGIYAIHEGPCNKNYNYCYNKIYPNEVYNNCLKSKSVGNYCTPWVIYKGNMDYLHCSDLSWNGKNKCQ